MRGARVVALLLLGAGLGCEVVERARGGAARDTAAGGEGGVTLNLESPGVIHPGEEAVIRLGVANTGDTAVSAVRAELVIPAWMEPLPPEPAGTEVTMVTSGEGTRLSYRVADPPLQPGESRGITQRVRTSAERAGAGEVSPSRTIRATLVRLDGQPLGAEVTSDVAFDTTALAAADTGAARQTGAADQVRAEGVGELRLGMTAAEVRRRFAGARDTSWTAEGTTERGLVVEPTGERDGGSVAALLEENRVSRLHVRDRRLRTAEGLGVGSRLEELRGDYGRACADVGEGAVVVWFPDRPGISWVLDMPVPSDVQALRRDPTSIPGSVTVRELFVRRGADSC